MSSHGTEPTLAVWLVPTGEVRDRFAEIIRSLAARFRTPWFEPHVTLLGGMAGPEGELVERTEDVAAALRPLEVRLTTAHARDDYFQSLVVKVEPTRELVEAQARARIVLGGTQEAPFFAHLSLMYGRTPMEEKEALLLELGNDFSDSFTARSLEVVSLVGSPDEWRRVGTCPIPERRRRPRAWRS